MPETQSRLRPWRSEDAAALHALYLDSGDLERQTGPLESITDAEQLIARYRTPATEGTGWVWKIDVAGTAAGAVAVVAVDQTHRTGWCWYWLDVSARGAGLATAALATAAHHAFSAGLFRLELGHRVDNPASCAVATRAGFAPEGIERAKLEYSGARFDCETHARLATDPAHAIDLLEVVTE